MSHKKILLIDDDSDDTQLFVEAVGAVNNQVECRTALNPVKALEELSAMEDLPDLLFLDYNMPAVNGLEFIQRMQQIERLRQIEVIVMSTPPEDVMVRWFARNNTSVRYLSKPNTMDELKAFLRELL